MPECGEVRTPEDVAHFGRGYPCQKHPPPPCLSKVKERWNCGAAHSWSVRVIWGKSWGKSLDSLLSPKGATNRTSFLRSQPSNACLFVISMCRPTLNQVVEGRIVAASNAEWRRRSNGQRDRACLLPRSRSHGRMPAARPCAAR